MKKNLQEDKKIVFVRATEYFIAPAGLPDEKLRHSVRRAVKSAYTPADLESKVWNLLRNNYN